MVDEVSDPQETLADIPRGYDLAVYQTQSER